MPIAPSNYLLPKEELDCLQTKYLNNKCSLNVTPTLHNVCVVHRGMLSTLGDIMSTVGDTMSTPGDTMSTPGDTMSTPGDVQYTGGLS